VLASGRGRLLYQLSQRDGAGCDERQALAAVFQLLTRRDRSTIVPRSTENISNGISPCLSYI
jgi:hypothetical protein